MIEIDLVTGFLGAGKTTFIREYAEYHMSRGSRVCVLENDFGAVNVDMLLLNDLYEKGCGLEMLAGGCDKDTHKRRLKTKLINMRMLGYERVIVEPSGIYDTEEFFDVLKEEPVDEWYHIDNVITLVDAGLDFPLPEESEYLCAVQLGCAGEVVLGKTDVTDEEKQRQTVSYLNSVLANRRMERRLDENALVNRSYKERFEELSTCGYRTEVPEKLWFDQKDTFETLYFMNHAMSRDALKDCARKLFADEACGKILRVKGFVKDAEGEGYLQLNATAKELVLTERPRAQAVLIVIGESLNREAISERIGKQADTL